MIQLTLTLPTIPTHPPIVCGIPIKIRSFTKLSQRHGEFGQYDPEKHFHAVECPNSYWRLYGSIWREFHDLPWEYAPVGVQESRITTFGKTLEQTIPLLMAWVLEVQEADRVLREEWGLPAQ